MKTSDEQQTIIDALSNSINVKCSSVAGSGKTTLVLELAKQNKDKHVIQITYNSDLKSEVRKKVVDEYIENLEIHTYHSLSCAYYNKKSYTDVEIKQILKISKKPYTKPKADILVVDEAQDMTFTYFEFVRKFINDLDNKRLTLLIIGDKKQCIYQFKEADPRYLTCADKIYGKEMVEKKMQRSFRVTNQIAWFVNNVMFDSPYITANKEGPKIKYICYGICNEKEQYDIPKLLAKTMKSMIDNKEIEASDIFVLGPTLKPKQWGPNPIQLLENEFVKKNIACYVSLSEDRKLDKRVIANKAVFTSIHQSKGRERKVVILYGFDNSFFKMFRNKPKNECCSELYVAVTRSLKYLYLVHDEKEQHLDFLNFPKMIENPEYVEYIGNLAVIENKAKGNYDNTPPPKCAVTELVKFLKDDALDFCTQVANDIFEEVETKRNEVEIESTLKNIFQNKRNYEDVSNLNGLAIPMMYEYEHKKKTAVQQKIQSTTLKTKDFFMRKHLGRLIYPCPDISDYLYSCNYYTSILSGFHSNLKQITSYKWLTPKMVDICLENTKNVSPKSEFEWHISAAFENDKNDKFSKHFLLENWCKGLY